MKMTNGKHKNDESLDDINKRVSKTENFEKLTETFRKQSLAAKEIKTCTAINLFHFYFDFSNWLVGPVKQLVTIQGKKSTKL